MRSASVVPVSLLVKLPQAVVEALDRTSLPQPQGACRWSRVFADFPST